MLYDVGVMTFFHLLSEAVTKKNEQIFQNFYVNLTLKNEVFERAITYFKFFTESYEKNTHFEICFERFKDPVIFE